MKRKSRDAHAKHKTEPHGAHDWHQQRSRQAPVALTTGTSIAPYAPSYWSGFSTNPLYLSSSPLITAS